MPIINTTDDIPDSSSSNILYSDQNIYNEEPANQEISSSHDQQLTALVEYPKEIEFAAIGGPISVDVDIIQKPLAPFTSTLSIINSTQECKACSSCYDINPTCYNDKIINNIDIKFPDNLVSYSEDEIWNMVESPRPFSLDHDHDDVNYESWKSGHETMEGVEYWVRWLEDELDQNHYQTIMSKLDQEPQIWIIPKGKLGILICRGNVLGTSLPDALHVVRPGLGVYNPMRCLERSLVGIVQVLQMLLDARIDICPALGLHMRLQVKLRLKSYTTKQSQS
nr:hypothetical protein [Tanacetum cinerariifolium]